MCTLPITRTTPDLSPHRDISEPCLSPSARRLAAATLEHLEAYIKPGVNTEELDDIVVRYVTANGASNAPLNYGGFPKSSCISVNHVALQCVPLAPSIWNADSRWVGRLSRQGGMEGRRGGAQFF